MAQPSPTLAVDGFALHAGAALPLLPELHALADDLPQRGGGTRLHDRPRLTHLTHHSAIATVAALYLGEDARPVRAILFDKTPQANWSLGWHQDRTIAVRERRETCGFGP